MSDAPPPPKRERRNALRFSDFRIYIFGRFVAALGSRMLAVAIGWELYQRTRDPLVLGGIGLVQIVPVMLLSLPAGQLADRYNRKRIVLFASLLSVSASAGLAYLSATEGSLPFIYLCLFMIGVFNALNGPSISALLGQAVPPTHYESAATISSGIFQFASVFGPTLGGAVIALFETPTLSYVINIGAVLIGAASVMFIRGEQQRRTRYEKPLAEMRTALHFIWRTKEFLGAITLDMMAVLFGGAVALMPVYATDILGVGAQGLGLMQAAPSLGAIVMALFLANRPPFQNAGRALLLAVAAFGVATFIFGISTNFILSLVMLFLIGAFDNISVVIRSALLLVRTPDEMRGRVSSVNTIFIGMSNELGSFESGVAARLVGTVGAVAGGGILTLIVVGLVALAFPDLRRLKTLTTDPPTLERDAIPAPANGLGRQAAD